MSRDLRAVASIFIAVALSGCVFLVDSLPDDTSTTCHLTTPEFETTGPCATCITSSCQTQLNACCADSTCQGQLSNVDECGTGECGALSGAAGTNATTGALVACIASSCTPSCYGIDAGGVDGSPSCSECNNSFCATNGEGTRWDCNPPTTAQPANSISCSNSTVENGVCCATSNYPSAGSSCDCVTMYCESDAENGTCDCEVGVFSQGAANVDICTSSTGEGCCLSADTTRCDCDPNDPCDQVGETQVFECDTDNMGCAPSASENTKRTSCSVTR